MIKKIIAILSNIARIIHNRGLIVLIITSYYMIKSLGYQYFIKKIISLTRGASDYSNWITLYDTIKLKDIELIKKSIHNFKERPLISIIMPVYNTNINFLKQAIDSVINQIYDNWQLCIVDDASTNYEVIKLLHFYQKKDARIKIKFRNNNGHIVVSSNEALGIATGEYVAFLDHDDILREHALFYVVKTINQNKNAMIIYSDEDKIDEKNNRFSPHFKSDFNYELFLSYNMINHFAVYRADIVKKIGGFAPKTEGTQDHDLALRIIERIDFSQIIHIPKILYSWRSHAGSTASDSSQKNYAFSNKLLVISNHFKRINIKANVSFTSTTREYIRVRYDLPQELPLVSIIIPTKDNVKLLSQCINSIECSKYNYPNYEIIIINNNSVEVKTDQYFQEISQNKNIVILNDNSPFNYSVINNRAVKIAKGEFICLMNNDIEIITQDWLREMVSFALRDGVGCVGARLWYPDGRLQHGGVIVGLGGVAGHAHQYHLHDDPGYFARAILHQNFSAVTAACLLVKKKIYEEVEGLEEKLTVAFNDVDFCLKVRERGYRNVWTPYAEMIHYESATRGAENTPEKIKRFQSEIIFMKEKWGDKLMKDPYYNPNLTLDYNNFSIASHPRLDLI